MNILYFEPLGRGWSRMKKALFEPFDIKKWFVVGFTAFLAELTDCHGGNGARGGTGPGKTDFRDLMDLPARARAWFLDNPALTGLIIAGAIVIVVLFVVLVWLSSRGKFMFLDNVVHDRAQVAKPWFDFAAQGNSLFLWTLSFVLVVIVVLGSYMAGCFSALHDLYEQDGFSAVFPFPSIWMLLGFFVLLILVGFIELLLSGFVVPIMYRNRITAMRAWSMFWGLFMSNPLQFVGYGLVVFVVKICIITGVVLVGLLTCCVGFLVLLIPYLSSVVLLPVSYAMRGFSVEFLEQFGPDYQIVPKSAGDQAPAQP